MENITCTFEPDAQAITAMARAPLRPPLCSMDRDRCPLRAPHPEPEGAPETRSVAIAFRSDRRTTTLSTIGAPVGGAPATQTPRSVRSVQAVSTLCRHTVECGGGGSVRRRGDSEGKRLIPANPVLIEGFATDRQYRRVLSVNDESDRH